MNTTKIISQEIYTRALEYLDNLKAKEQVQRLDGSGFEKKDS